MNEWIKSLFNDGNGKPSSKRVLGFVYVLSFNGLAIFDVCILHNKFDYLAYGQGAALMIAPLGIWFGVEQIGK